MNKPEEDSTPTEETPEGIVQAILALVWGKPWTPYFIGVCLFAVVAFGIWQSLPDATKLRLLGEADQEQVETIPDPLGEVNVKISKAESKFDLLDGVDTHKQKLDALTEKYPKGFDVTINPFGETGKQSRSMMTDCLTILKRLESYDLTDTEKEDAKKAHSWSTGLTADPLYVHQHTVQLAESLVNRRAGAQRELKSLSKEKERIISAK